jgi:hypothetical protein
LEIIAVVCNAQYNRQQREDCFLFVKTNFVHISI